MEGKRRLGRQKKAWYDNMGMDRNGNVRTGYDSDDAGYNDDYGGSGTDDQGGNVTDDDDDGDDSGPPLGLISGPGCRNVWSSKSKTLGLRKCAALHGRRTTKASRPHTHTHASLSGNSRCRLTASRPRTHTRVSIRIQPM
ncbi:hypothetical protein ElyMa_001874000 [Elysia marginata]|uniref:Uncharacterized protein n=1 Tax=Elysia marginata TaxID=1093978 RepID=A0AAV4EPZ3_9GAST|nr:hypothetical protein ElyMa_001874000 [Elysia marginata]